MDSKDEDMIETMNHDDTKVKMEDDPPQFIMLEPSVTQLPQLIMVPPTSDPQGQLTDSKSPVNTITIFQNYFLLPLINYRMSHKQPFLQYSCNNVVKQ